MNWPTLKETVYKFDGAWLDIYVLDTKKMDWKKWIDLINEKYPVVFASNEDKITRNLINYELILEHWNGNSDYLRRSTLMLRDIDINCHFFTESEIENDVDPRKVKGIQDHLALMDYMLEVSNILNKSVILTPENAPSIVLIECFQGRVNVNEFHWR